MTVNLRLHAWSAWAPGLHDQKSWAHWLQNPYPLATSGQPPCEQVPALIRRRCGQNARMVMETLFSVCTLANIPADQPHLVLGSPNGENHALRTLLEDLVQDQPLSPTAFTNSLHHVPTGFYSIVAQHKGISRTISAFEDTFACGWLETASLLQRCPSAQAVLILVDEIPPEPFDQMLEVPPFPYAVAFLLGLPGSGHQTIQLAIGRNPEPVTPSPHTLPLFQFLAWLTGPSPSCTLQAAFGALTWQKT